MSEETDITRREAIKNIGVGVSVIATLPVLGQGVRLTVHGHRSATPGQNVIKAERVMIDGRTFDLYPDRD